jgi:CxxC motif-containing protein (DUF1111 family)
VDVVRRIQGASLWALVAIGCAANCTRNPQLGEPVRGLTPAQRQAFERGKRVFAHPFSPDSGLGPLFNATSCVECHEDPVLGGIGDEMELHATRVLADGSCDALGDRGGFVFQQHVTPALQAALGITSEPVPADAAQGLRTSPDLFGFGLLDAVPDHVILSHADPDDADHDGISGRANYFVVGRKRRFGRKAFVPTLAEFNAGAFLIELGITNPVFPAEGSVGGLGLPAGVDPVPDPELDAHSLRDANAFVRYLAPPARVTPTRAARHGQRVFASIRCDACHIPSLRTGKSDVHALDHRKVDAYTDLLLHDMGPDLADLCLGAASPSEFRTEPLMGLRLETRFLHDGRAASIEEAIRLHAGEASAARDAFMALRERERAALLEFLRGL